MENSLNLEFPMSEVVLLWRMQHKKVLLLQLFHVHIAGTSFSNSLQTYYFVWVKIQTGLHHSLFLCSYVLFLALCHSFASL